MSKVALAAEEQLAASFRQQKQALDQRLAEARRAYRGQQAHRKGGRAHDAELARVEKAGEDDVTERRGREGEGSRLWLDLPEPLLRYCVEKGSIAVDGVSLTVAELDAGGIAIALVPHTLKETTLGALKPGDQVELLAPLGHGFFEEDYLPVAQAADEVLHVAGGIGIAALLLLARQIAKAGIRQQLFFGGRTADDLVGTEGFESYVEGMTLATENGSKGHRGFVTAPLEEYLAARPKQKFLLMACGPWAMLRATVDLAGRYGHPCLVSMENRMGCGLGVCLGCSIRVEGTGHAAYERVCTEGPVFRAERVIWEREEIPKI